MVVADGMGGHKYGDLAAQIATQATVDYFQRKARPRLEDPRAFLGEAAMLAHNGINKYAHDHGLLETPHTTGVLCLVQDETAYWAHIGDSRLYLFSEGKLVARTFDHSTVEQMFRQGLIREDEMLTHPERNKIYNCLGGYIVPEVEQSGALPLNSGDTLLLCSDGVWSVLTQEEIAITLETFPLEQAVTYLMDHAEFRGGEMGDNLSLVAMTWGEARKPDPHVVQTQDMEARSVSTLVSRPMRPPGEEDGLDIADDDIEKTIAEIQAAISRRKEG
jgi:serine/threonine protein phosphatase PrpC